MATNEIKVLKLVSNEVLIGIIEVPVDDRIGGFEEQEGTGLEHLLFVRSPMKVVCEYDANKIPHIHLLDWIPGTEDEVFAIQKSQILAAAAPRQEMEELYVTVMLSRALEEDPNMDITEEEKDVALKQLLNNIEFDGEDEQ